MREHPFLKKLAISRYQMNEAPMNPKKKQTNLWSARSLDLLGNDSAHTKPARRPGRSWAPSKTFTLFRSLLFLGRRPISGDVFFNCDPKRCPTRLSRRWTSPPKWKSPRKPKKKKKNNSKQNQKRRRPIWSAP